MESISTSTESPRPVVVSHGEDLDGVTSAVLASTYLRCVRGVMPQVFFSDYSQMDEVIARAAQNADELWITDLSFKDETLFDRLLSRFAPGKIVLIDHHASSRQCLEAWGDRATIVFDDSGEKCAADLVWRRIHTDVEFTTENLQSTRDYIALCELQLCAHDRDLWKRQIPDADALTDVIAVMGPDRAFRSLMEAPHRSFRVHFDTAMELCVEVADRSRRDSLALAQATRYATEIKLGEDTQVILVCAQATGHQSDVGDHLQAEAGGVEGRAVIVVLYDVARASLSFRTSRATPAYLGYGVNAIAETFGGGGHPYAAGSPMPPLVVIGGPLTLAGCVGQALRDLSGVPSLFSTTIGPLLTEITAAEETINELLAEISGAESLHEEPKGKTE